jgi:hypothetical protein
MNTVTSAPVLQVNRFTKFNEIIKTVLLCIHYEFYKRGLQRDHFHKHAVGLTVLILIGYIKGWLELQFQNYNWSI